METPEICPNCGAEVPPGAAACPECGADESTGWNDRAVVQGLGIPDEDDFDAEEFCREEFGTPGRRGPHPAWAGVAVVLLAVLVWWLLRR